MQILLEKLCLWARFRKCRQARHKQAAELNFEFLSHWWIAARWAGLLQLISLWTHSWGDKIRSCVALKASVMCPFAPLLFQSSHSHALDVKASQLWSSGTGCGNFELTLVTEKTQWPLLDDNWLSLLQSSRVTLEMSPRSLKSLVIRCTIAALEGGSLPTITGFVSSTLNTKVSSPDLIVSHNAPGRS